MNIGRAKSQQTIPNQAIALEVSPFSKYGNGSGDISLFK